MEKKKVSDIVEIRAPNIDVGEVHSSLEQNITSRHPQAEVPYLPSYDDLLHLKEPEVLDAIGYHLWQATKVDAVVHQALVSSRIPILGPFIDRVKLEFHNLVVYYLNLLVSRQAIAYANLALAVQLLAKELAELRTHIVEQEANDDGGS